MNATRHARGLSFGSQQLRETPLGTSDRASCSGGTPATAKRANRLLRCHLRHGALPCVSQGALRVCFCLTVYFDQPQQGLPACLCAVPLQHKPQSPLVFVVEEPTCCWTAAVHTIISWQRVRLGRHSQRTWHG